MLTAGDMDTNTILPPWPSPEFENINVLLASNSPRRRQLLHFILPHFEIADNKDVDESYPATLTPEQVPAFVAGLKANAHRSSLTDDELMITADTVVILDGRIYGKPHSRCEALDMIGKLSGRTHKVVTGVALTMPGHNCDIFSETTLVEFANLSPQEIETYVDIFKPYDKAGAYGVQEWIGAVGIKSITGCFYNVMGLPLHTLYTHLTKLLH